MSSRNLPVARYHKVLFHKGLMSISEPKHIFFRLMKYRNVAVATLATRPSSTQKSTIEINDRFKRPVQYRASYITIQSRNVWQGDQGDKLKPQAQSGNGNGERR